MSDTPMTDSRIVKMLSDLQSGTMDVVHADFARDLERALAAAERERDELNNVLRKAGWGQGEIDSAALREALEDAERTFRLTPNFDKEIECLARIRRALAGKEAT